MRHIRARRKLKSILVLLAAACLMLFVETRIEAFIPQFGPKRVDFNTGFKSADFLIFDIKTSHIRLWGYDIVCEAVLKNKIVRDSRNSAKTRLEGELRSSRIILNGKLLPDIAADYVISDGILDIKTLILGNGIRVQGQIHLSSPYNMDLVLTANNVSISWLLSSLGLPDASSILSGTMNSKIELKGPLANLRSNSRLELRRGTIATLDFETLSASLKGDGPIIRVEDSRITREGGHFSLAGEMDLRRLGRNNLFDGIRITTDEGAITWDGWNASKVLGSQEITMKKKISDDLHIDFKRFIADEKVDESSRYADEVQLEYKLHPKDSLKMMIGPDKDFVGFEHKDRF